MLEVIENNGKYFIGVNTSRGFVFVWGWENLADFGEDLKRWVDFYNEHHSEIPDVYKNAFNNEGG